MKIKLCDKENLNDVLFLFFSNRVICKLFGHNQNMTSFFSATRL